MEIDLSKLVNQLLILANTQEEYAPYDCVDDSKELRQAADRIRELEIALRLILNATNHDTTIFKFAKNILGEEIANV